MSTFITIDLDNLTPDEAEVAKELQRRSAVSDMIVFSPEFDVSDDSNIVQFPTPDYSRITH